MIRRGAILWILSIVIVILLFYVKQITSSEYPLTGVVSIGNSELLYRLERTNLANEPIKILIRSDNQNLMGILEWKFSDTDFQKTSMQFSDGAYSANIPAQKVGNKFYYRIIFRQGTVQKIIPSNEMIEMKIKGKIPGMLEFYYFLFVVLGMVLSIRTGLEYFNESPKTKKLSFITVFFFFGYLIFTPLKYTYEIGAINYFVPGITKIFDLQPIIFLALWIFATILIFRNKRPERIALSASLFSVLILIFL